MGDRLRNSRFLRIVRRGYNLDRWSRFSTRIQNSEKMALEIVADRRLAMLPDDNGRPLLFKAVSNHEQIAEMVLNDPELARIEHGGLTVAHIAVAHHRIIARRLLDQNCPLLKLRSGKGPSVEMFARISLDIE